MLLSSEDIICIELGILLSSWPSTCLNLNKLFLFGIIMMGKAAGAGKCAFEMISLRLKVAHHKKKSCPALFCKLAVFTTEMLKEVWLIKILKNSLGLLFFVVDVLIWWLSQQISLEKHFYQELRDLGAFYFYLVLKAWKMDVLVSVSVDKKSSR